MSEKIWVALFLLIVGLALVFIFRETIKRKFQERIERNSVKVPNVVWTKRNGETITEDVIIKRSGIPFIGDWGRIYPIIDEDGRTNWINLIFGGKKNFGKLLLIMAIMVGLFLFIGSSREFLDGNKYVIVAKEDFQKFCKSSDGNFDYVLRGNTTLFNITIETEPIENETQGGITITENITENATQ